MTCKRIRRNVLEFLGMADVSNYNILSHSSCPPSKDKSICNQGVNCGFFGRRGSAWPGRSFQRCAFFLTNLESFKSFKSPIGFYFQFQVSLPSRPSFNKHSKLRFYLCHVTRMDDILYCNIYNIHKMYIFLFKLAYISLTRYA